MVRDIEACRYARVCCGISLLQTILHIYFMSIIHLFNCRIRLGRHGWSGPFYCFISLCS